MKAIDVDIWQFSLGLSSERISEYAALLAKDERERADRYRFSRDRDRFVAARGSLRLILAKYLNLSPQVIRFRYGGNGKPWLETDGLESRLSFNLSHSQDLGVLAVTWGGEVGVDVEEIAHDVVDGLAIAEQFFTTAETGLIRRASPEARGEVFFRLWTRKEAFLKACGDGLSGPLNQFEVSLEGSKISFEARTGDGYGSWSLHEFRPCPGYVAALAVEGEVQSVKLLNFDPEEENCSVR